MGVFVLVHGSFHGGWCWENVARPLVATGHRVLAPDLPGRGDARPLRALTLDIYAAKIAEVVAGEAEPVVLAGHSMGGVVITAVAERLPQRIKRLVYVCAYLPANGQSLLDLAKTDTESVLLRHLVFEEAKGSHHIRSQGAREAFYHDCPADADRAIKRLVPESLAVVGTPVATTAARFGSVARTYVECTDDRAVGPALQRRMHGAQPCDVVSLASSHSPFYAQPDALARILAAYA